MIRIISPGPLTSVQDGGRRGCQSQGYRECGAADMYSLEAANAMVGNDDLQAAALEITISGGVMEFTEPVIFAVTGGDFALTLDGERIPVHGPVYAGAGSRLTIGPAASGLRGCLAVYGGIDVPLLLGSRSTDLTCRLGGYRGRALKEGDEIPVGVYAVKGVRDVEKRRAALAGRNLLKVEADRSRLVPSGLGRFFQGERIRVLRAVKGPQEEYFTEGAHRTFERSVYTITPQSDRMGCRLSGPALETVHGCDIISDGIVGGSVQVSSDGQPIIMQADHQTTGGYAKIATVISADLPALAQLRPGDKVGFRFVSPKEAVMAVRELQAGLLSLKEVYG